MHKTTGRWKYAALAAATMALATTAGCGGGGGVNDTKLNPNIVGPWLLINLITPKSTTTSSTTIVCPGTAAGVSCTSNQELSFANNGNYAAYINGTEIAAGVYSLNGNLLTVNYHYIVAPSLTYTDTYLTNLVVATQPGFVNSLYATLSSSTDPTSSTYLGVQYQYGYL
jgi:hypothetical protein